MNTNEIEAHERGLTALFLLYGTVALLFTQTSTTHDAWNCIGLALGSLVLSIRHTWKAAQIWRKTDY